MDDGLRNGSPFFENLELLKLYNQTVVSLAVLCDDRPDWRPTQFRYGHWDCEMVLTFRVAKLLDFKDDTELVASKNPFAMVVLAHHKAMDTRDNPASRRRWKLRIIKELLQGKWTKEEVPELFRLIDWIMTLPAELEEAFRADLTELEKEHHVEYLSSLERYGFKKGRLEGFEKGLEKGREKGLAEGREKGKGEGLLEGIRFLLDAKFGVHGMKLLPQVRRLKGLAALREFARFLKQAKSLDDVREYLKLSAD